MPGYRRLPARLRRSRPSSVGTAGCGPPSWRPETDRRWGVAVLGRPSPVSLQERFRCSPTVLRQVAVQPFSSGPGRVDRVGRAAASPSSTPWCYVTLEEHFVTADERGRGEAV